MFKRSMMLVLMGVVVATMWTQSGYSAEPKVVFNQAEYRDKVYACWLGKNIGGTLGVPFEGKREANNITFYTNLKPGEPAANDDLDLQMLWLKAMEEHDGRVDARILGEYWLKFVPVDWNEYGVGKRNMKQGFLPPLSGEFANAQWKHSNGAWIRSEIWACLAPGCPALAAQMAREDACVDHGAAEGTLAEIFTASLESAAFVEHDMNKLIGIGLSMIPQDCGLARAIHAVLDAKAADKDWKAAREDVIKVTEDTGWFQAPRNVAYTMLGWVFGEGDFGNSLCIAINCGDDTDCTGATLGSIFGIINGTAGIPAKWREPIGTKINTVAIGGFEAPKDLDQLTDHTVAMAKEVLAMNNAPVAITDSPTDLSRAGELVLPDPAAAKAPWALSPFQIVWNEKDTQVVLDYVSDPVIKAGLARAIKVTVNSLTDAPVAFSLAMINAPENWRVTGLPTEPVSVSPKGGHTFDVEFTAPATELENRRMMVNVVGGATPIAIPLTFAWSDAAGKDNLALGSKGATVKTDSEYEQEANCSVKAVDGVVATAEDFANRWHSSLQKPHPHWIEVKLAKPAEVGRVVIRFADPRGYPTSFEGAVKPEGSNDLRKVFDIPNNTDSRVFRATIAPVMTDTFRLTIRASANADYPNAAQISEIELYPGGK